MFANGAPCKGGVMIVYAVHVKVIPGREQDFIEATKRNHENTRLEPGNKCFDELQNAEDPASFMLYEVYESVEAVTAHKETPHYAAWRDTVADWMAEPRRGEKYDVIAPTKGSAW